MIIVFNTQVLRKFITNVYPFILWWAIYTLVGIQYTILYIIEYYTRFFSTTLCRRDICSQGFFLPKLF